MTKNREHTGYKHAAEVISIESSRRMKQQPRLTDGKKHPVEVRKK